jgi:hypothetical protein
MCRRLLPLTGPLVPILLASMLLGCGSSSQGNGIAEKTPGEILASAKVLADDASSAHVFGSITSAGSPIALNLYLHAKRGRGEISENGLPFELIRVADDVYIKGSNAFYRHIAGPTAAQLLQGRWLKASATSGSLASVGSLTDLRQLVDATLTGHGALVKGPTTTVAGRRVIALTDPSEGGTLYVATTGPPYPVEVTKGGAAAGQILFDDWNDPVLVTPPADAIDITKLESGG